MDHVLELMRDSRSWLMIIGKHSMFPVFAILIPSAKEPPFSCRFDCPATFFSLQVLWLVALLAFFSCFFSWPSFWSFFEFPSLSPYVCLFIRSILSCSVDRRRRAQSLKYLSNREDQRQHLNPSGHSTSKGIQIEHPHLLSTTATTTSAAPSSFASHRPHSSMISSENLSDREALLQQGTSTSLENFYEEIEEHHHHQQQREGMNLALGNPYLESRSIEDRRKLFDDTRSSQPIRDHREVFYYDCEGWALL